MTGLALDRTETRSSFHEATAWQRLKLNRNWLSFWFMLPAAAFLILFL
ncbi:MAG TPA: sugar ABC transporter permease, partial [Xanthobacteraceae bacterium]|nr:sugar ABC transporter permease [Xanthobacteraceae bacterium]